VGDRKLSDKKISELTALTGANVADTDLLPIVDISETETKKITFGEFKTALDTATGFVRITGDTMTGALDVQSTITADGLTVSTTSGDTPASIVTTTSGSFLEFTDGNTTAGRSPLVGAITDGLAFYTSAGSYSQKMAIDASGNVGIGTSSPNAVADLHVADTSDARIWLDATSADTMELYSGTGVGMFNMRIDSLGNVGIGVSNPSSYQGNADNLVVGNLVDAGTGITIVSLQVLVVSTLLIAQLEMIAIVVLFSITTLATSCGLPQTPRRVCASTPAGTCWWGLRLAPLVLVVFR
jgi:hypothetical protein